MKVDFNNLDKSSLDTVTSTQRSASATQPAASDPVHGADEDAATFSSTSTGVASLAAKALETSPVRADKIEALRQAVQNGTYKIDPSEIAEAILRQSVGPVSK